MMHIWRNPGEETLPRGSACFRCRRNKRRCDGVKPSCGTCVKTGHPEDCEYRISTTATETRAVRPRNRASRSTKNDTQRQEVALQMAVMRHEVSRTVNEVPPKIIMVDPDIDWWKLDEMPEDHMGFLMNVFIQHSSQAHFEELYPSVVTRMARFPRSHPEYPHPALINAMILISSFYLSSPAHPARVEKHLRWGTKTELELLEKTQRLIHGLFHGSGQVPRNYLFDLLLAMGLVTRYLYYTMRHGEGYQQSFTTMRLAVYYNLHKIDSLDPAEAPDSPLPPPTSSTDLRDRMNAFWHVFNADRGGSVATALHVTCADDDISTAFPQKPSACPDSLISKGTIPTVNALKATTTGNDGVIQATHDTMHVMKTKVLAQLDIVRKLVRRATGEFQEKEAPAKFANLSPSLQSDILSAEAAVLFFQSTLPAMPPFSLQPRTTDAFDLLLVHTLTRACIIRLHVPFAILDLESAEKMFLNATEILEISRRLEAGVEIIWPTPIHFGWINTCEVFHQEINRIFSGNFVGEAEIAGVIQLRSNIQYLAAMMRRYLNVYRFHHPSLRLIEGLLVDSALKLSQFDEVGGDKVATLLLSASVSPPS